MRLIDADKLKEAIEEEKDDNDYMCRLCLESIKEIIDEQPTAFDVDKIVEQLETRKTRAAALQKENISEYFEGETDAFEFAIKIVKEGGVE